MPSIYLPTSGNYHPEGTPVKVCFGGTVTRGTLAGYDSDRKIVGVNTPDGDGEVHWAHESFVSLDCPEPPLRRRIQASF